MAATKSLLLPLLFLGTFCAGALGSRVLTSSPTASISCKSTNKWKAGNAMVEQFVCTTTVENNNRAVCIKFNCGSIDPKAKCSDTNKSCIYSGQVSPSCSTPYAVWFKGPFVFTLQSTKGNPGISVASVTPGEKCQ